MLKNVLRSVAVNVPVEKAYAIWQDFANYARFLPHVQESRVEGRRMVWKVIVNGRPRRWVFEVVEMTPPHRIAWHARDGRHHRIVVTLVPLGDERTEVSLGAEYELARGECDDKGERFDHYLDGFRSFAERGEVFDVLPGKDQSLSREARM